MGGRIRSHRDLSTFKRAIALATDIFEATKIDPKSDSAWQLKGTLLSEFFEREFNEDEPQESLAYLRLLESPFGAELYTRSHTNDFDTTLEIRRFEKNYFLYEKRSDFEAKCTSISQPRGNVTKCPSHVGMSIATLRLPPVPLIS